MRSRLLSACRSGQPARDRLGLDGRIAGAHGLRLISGETLRRGSAFSVLQPNR
jgi:hypothetical protein